MSQKKCFKTSLRSKKTTNAVLRLRMRANRECKTADSIIYATAQDEVDPRDAQRYWNAILRQNR